MRLNVFKYYIGTNKKLSFYKDVKKYLCLILQSGKIMKFFIFNDILNDEKLFSF